MTREEELDRTIRAGARAADRSGACLDDERLAEFYQDALPEVEADRVRAHISTCSDCFQAARDAERFVAVMGTVERDRPRVRSRAPLYAMAAAAAGIGLIAGALFVATRDGGEQARVTWTAVVVTPAPYETGSDDLVWRGSEPSETASPLDAATARYRAGDYTGAVADLATYVAAHPDDPRGRFYLGVARLLAGSPALAVADLEAAQALPGSPADAAWYLAVARLKAGDPARARAELERIAASEHTRSQEARALLRRLEEEAAR